MSDTVRFPLFLQYCRQTLNLTDDQWTALVIAVATNPEDTEGVYATADRLGFLNEAAVAFAQLGGNPQDAVKNVYDQAVKAGICKWNESRPFDEGGVPAPFAKIPKNLIERFFSWSEADSSDFTTLVMVAIYDYQLSNRREFIKGDFRFSKKLVVNASGSPYEDVEDSLDEMVSRHILIEADGFYRLWQQTVYTGTNVQLLLEGQVLKTIEGPWKLGIRH